MSEDHPTAPAPSGKPAKPSKPSPDFPLTAHPAGYWCKKIGGKTHYFGPWADPEGALRAYREFVAGRPVVKPARSGPGHSDRPAKPNPDFPLFPHATGQWAKKIRGRTLYFGPWADPDGALKKYLAEKNDLHAGRTPRTDPEAVTVRHVCNHFRNAKEALVRAGELSPRTLREYVETTDLLADHFGMGRLASDVGPDDFAALRARMDRKWGLVRIDNAIQRVRSVFKHAFDAGLIDRPVRFGPGFKRPSKKSLRIHRARQGAKLFTAEEVRRMIDAAGQPLKAMILLAINAGFGNADCGTLPLSAVSLDTGWIDYPRPKTGMPRRCALWTETIQALRVALAVRPRPKKEEHGGLVFVTKYGDTWHKDTPDGPISKETRKLLDSLGINGRRGLGFYTLRHIFRTVADGAKDQPAADYIMGHEVAHMSSVYREGIDDVRLKAVSDYVRQWLFRPPELSAKQTSPTPDALSATTPVE
jgi:integrase